MAKSNYTSKRGNDYKIQGGVYTGYSYKNASGENPPLGFESIEDTKDYIENKEFLDNYANENYGLST